MFQIEMTAEVRTATGKGEMRRLRSEGLTPAVVYGEGKEATMLQMNTKVLMKQLLEYYRKNTVVTMNINNGESKSVLIKEVQTDPVKDTLVHVDFLQIDLEKSRRFTVPVTITGKAKGVDLGGILEIGTRQVVLEGAPLSIPDALNCDVTPMKIGDVIKINEIELPENVTLITKGDKMCVQVVSPVSGD